MSTTTMEKQVAPPKKMKELTQMLPPLAPADDRDYRKMVKWIDELASTSPMTWIVKMSFTREFLISTIM